MRHSLFVMIVGATLTGCAGARAWSAAKRADTPNDYAAFIAQWPGHAKARAAERRQEELSWSIAQSTDASSAYSAYLGAHPSGPHAVEARERAETLSWSEARTAATVEALTGYVARHPSSVHVTEANVLIELAWITTARTDDTEEAWGRYLVRYPSGQYVAEARDRLSELAWARTMSTDTKDAHERYMSRFPDSPHADEAWAWLEGLRVTELQPIVRLVESWQGDGMAGTVLSRVRRQLDEGLVYDLKRDFTVRRTITDAPALEPGAEAPHPQEVWGTDAGVGLLVVEYREERGRKFEPRGHATDIVAELRLYVSTTSRPVWKRTIEASTPGQIFGTTEAALHTSAVEELGSLMRGAAFPVEDHEVK